MSCPGNIFTKSANLVKDRVGRGGPDERPGLGVIVCDESVDLIRQFLDAAERATTNGALGDDVEPNLYLVEPRRVGGRKRDMVAGAGGKPALDSRMLMGGVVVDDQVDVTVSRNVDINVL